MDAVRSWYSQVWAHLSSLGRRARVLGLFLLAMAVAGGVLLVASTGGDDSVPVAPEPMPPEQLLRARSVLEERGIRFEIDSGRLLVGRQDVQRVRALLAGQHLLGRAAASAFEKLAGEDDIWQTQAQSAKRWQAAKMAELSRLICEFPPVQRATVILESGSPRRLGAVAVPPTAAVHVRMRDGAAMTPKLAQAVADLVAGSVAGMKAGDVRIVDSSGQSFRVPDAGPATRPGLAEDPPTAGAGNRAARNEAPGWSADPAALGPDSEDATNQAADSGMRTAAIGIALVGVAVLGAAGAGWLVLRRRSRRDRQPGPLPEIDEGETPPLVAPRNSSPAQPPEETPSAGRFGFLRGVPAAELAGLLEPEHPQTLAIVLAHLPAEQAGAVLAGLSDDRKVEVARRVVDLNQVDPAVVAEIEQALSSRLAEVGRRQEVCGGPTTIAQILQHAGYATEKTVLEALRAQRPMLAERIRRRLLVFEDVAKVPADSLRAALTAFGSEELAVALRTAGRDLKRHVLSSLPGSAARQVRREMHQMGPVRLSDVEAAQQRIVDAVRHLAEEAVSDGPAVQARPYVA